MSSVLRRRIERLEPRETCRKSYPIVLVQTGESLEQALEVAGVSFDEDPLIIQFVTPPDFEGDSNPNGD